MIHLVPLGQVDRRRLNPAHFTPCFREDKLVAYEGKVYVKALDRLVKCVIVHTTQNKQCGNKQVARVRRDEERRELQEWMTKFIRAARYASQDDKQQLEVLGIVVPS